MPAQLPAPGKPLVLVVDDEPLIRMSAIDSLEEAGLSALEASNADEALGILEARADIKVLITDIDMPAGSMNGLRLAASVSKRWSEIHIIIVSGHHMASAGEIPPGAIFLSKPYILDDLAAKAASLIS